MFKSNNFIYFLTVTGFFIGLMFAILNEFEPLYFLYVVMLNSFLFYMIGIASSGFFIKYLSIKQIFELDKESLEMAMDMQIQELDKKEDLIREAHYFIKQIEEEELLFYKDKEDKKGKNKR